MKTKGQILIEAARERMARFTPIAREVLNNVVKEVLECKEDITSGLDIAKIVIESNRKQIEIVKKDIQIEKMKNQINLLKQAVRSLSNMNKGDSWDYVTSGKDIGMTDL